MSAPLPPALACDRLEWLPQEASARRYGRLHGPRRHDRPTAVLMAFARGTPPQEVARVERSTRLLAEAGVPVPEVLDSAPEQRWILQEDLGDVTLAEARRRGQPVAEAYSAAVALLPTIEPLDLDTSPRPPLGQQRLANELHQFATLALGLGEGAGPGLAAELEELVRRCCERPSVLCHRDYHGRNLLLHEGRVRVIDHQDALRGPAGYDRVSLAYDPYVDLPDPIRDRIAGEGEGLAAVAVQRLAKAIGTFADKGGAWSAFIAPAARQARRLLARDGLDMPLLDLALNTLALPGRAAESAP